MASTASTNTPCAPPSENELPIVLSEITSDAKKKRRRNKPTLTCRACVGRRTRCNKERPNCLACVRRGTECLYQEPSYRSDPVGGARVLPIDARKSGESRAVPGVNTTKVRTAARLASPTAIARRRLSTVNVAEEPLLSDIPYASFSAISNNSFDSEHPFRNYWTLSGGLAEVIQILPSNEQADILLAKFFDAIGSIFPIIHQGKFYDQYEHFCCLSTEGKARAEPSFVALVFAMLASGTQFMRLSDDSSPSNKNEAHGAELFASACHQALQLGAYLTQTSVPILQAMLLMTYYLVNANRSSDGWAFLGIVIRQAYAIGLNRDPSMLSKPKATRVEQIEKSLLWKAMLCLDTSMAVVLKLPPGATHSDVDETPPLREGYTASNAPHSNPSPVKTEDTQGLLTSNFDSTNDIEYCHGMYSLSILVRDFIATPRSLSLRLASTPEQRTRLLARFYACRQSWSDTYRTWDEEELRELGSRDLAGRRVARQIFFLTSHYWHAVMLINIEGCESADGQGKGEGQWDLMGCVVDALQAAHDVLRAFFVLPVLLEGDAGSWWTLSHRAFSAALTVADLLKKHDYAQPDTKIWAAVEGRDPAQTSRIVETFIQARKDFRRTIDMFKSISDNHEGVRVRVRILLDTIGTLDVGSARR